MRLYDLYNGNPYTGKMILYTEMAPRGPDLIWKCHLTSIGNPSVKIRRSYDRLVSTMEFSILVRQHLYIESGPWGWWSQYKDVLPV